jgi:ethanolamine utilization protein EutA
VPVGNPAGHHHAVPRGGAQFHDHGEELTDAERAEFESERWNPDDIQLTTVGVDIGSSTSHLMFSRIQLRRLGQSLSSRYVVISREPIHRSRIRLTPYTASFTIDAGVLQGYVEESFAAAGLTPADIDTGAVILTGEAIRRDNARAIADLFAAYAGRFVCATAGHNLEAVLSAHGSGAVELSRVTGRLLLNVDIGGGTSKLTVVRAGEILETAAISVGGRLVAFGPGGRLTRVEDAARSVAERLGIEVALGEVLSPGSRQRLAEALGGALLEAMAGGSPGPAGRSLMLTDPLSPGLLPELITFSGGVSEYIYGREERDFGDLAQDLAAVVAAAHPHPPALAEGIRATVIGASQYTVQVSGDTLALTRPGLLPLRNLPVLYVRLAEGADVSGAAVAAAIAAGFRRLDLEPGAQPVALAIDWLGIPNYRNLSALAEGVRSGLETSIAAGHPVVMVFRHDVAKLVGDILRKELGHDGDLVSIDSVELQELDFIDIGELIDSRRVVPVVVKSLVFSPAGLKAELVSAINEEA